MSKLDAVAATAAEVADHFSAMSVRDLLVSLDTVEGRLGVVVHRADGRLHLRQMTWGFTRFIRAMNKLVEKPGRVDVVKYAAVDAVGFIWTSISETVTNIPADEV